MSVERTGVLFVCLGNICRSPLAEGIFVDLIQKRGIADRFDVDSCGTGDWHRGERVDPRSVAIAHRFGIALNHRARSFEPAHDGDRFRWLIAMDRSNVRNLVKAGAAPTAIKLIRTFDPAMMGKKESELDVPDPFGWEGDGFVVVYNMLAAACGGLVDFLVDEMES